MINLHQNFLRAAALFIALLGGLLPLCFGQKKYDIVFRGGTIVDGSGAPRFHADVAIRGDRIVRITSSLPAEDAELVVDTKGLIVAPGFICNHSHIGPTIPQFPLEENFIRQGISTMLATQHSGDVPWPLKPYMDSLRMAPNVGFFAGHNWIRKQVMGLENRVPTPQELERMKNMVEQNMKDGALGLATGLEYVPATYSGTEEVIELAKVAASYGGIFVTHMRYEGSSILFPPWSLADGPKALAKRLADPNKRVRIEKEVRAIFFDQLGDDLRNVQFRRLRSDPSYNGRTLAEYVIEHGLPATLDSGVKTLIDLQLAGGFSGIFYGMDEEDVKRIMQHPWAMFDTDGDPVGYGQGFPHPRSYGAFPRVLARYVREQKTLTLEEAIRKMTSLPAHQINQTERGLLVHML